MYEERCMHMTENHRVVRIGVVIPIRFCIVHELVHQRIYTYRGYTKKTVFFQWVLFVQIAWIRLHAAPWMFLISTAWIFNCAGNVEEISKRRVPKEKGKKGTVVCGYTMIKCIAEISTEKHSENASSRIWEEYPIQIYCFVPLSDAKYSIYSLRIHLTGFGSFREICVTHLLCVQCDLLTGNSRHSLENKHSRKHRWILSSSLNTKLKIREKRLQVAFVQ